LSFLPRFQPDYVQLFPNCFFQHSIAPLI
jgi:hypothetical protein